MDHNNIQEDNVENHTTTSVVHFSNNIHHHFHTHFHFSFNQAADAEDEAERTGTTSAAAVINNKPTYRVYTKANASFCLTIRRGNVVLAEFDQTNEYQLWYKVDDYKSLVKDNEGCVAFALVNKVTGEAIRHSIDAYHPVRLVMYNPCSFDESILWTESIQCFEGYRTLRSFNNIQLNMDADGGGTVQDGTAIIMWKWNEGENQKWKIAS